MNKNNTFILYHAHCTDGTGSKFAAWKKFKNKATYIAVQYNKPPPSELDKDSEVYIVDFSYPREVLIGLQSLCKTVVVLDHHKTAKADLEGLKDCHFDMERSGCVMTWNYFHPNVPVPQILLNIQDRDLWKFQIPNSEEIHAGLKLLMGDMNKWDECVYSNIVAQGKILLQNQNLSVESAVKNKVKVVNFLGYKCGMTNTTDYSSEIGNAICVSKEYGPNGPTKVDFSCPYCITNDDEALLSFRSIGEFDVSVIAAKFGGGGHKNAAGAKVSLETLCKILKGNL